MGIQTPRQLIPVYQTLHARFSTMHFLLQFMFANIVVNLTLEINNLVQHFFLICVVTDLEIKGTVQNRENHCTT